MEKIAYTLRAYGKMQSYLTLELSCVSTLYLQLDHKHFEDQNTVIHFYITSNTKYGIGEFTMNTSKHSLNLTKGIELQM